MRTSRFRRILAALIATLAATAVSMLLTVSASSAATTSSTPAPASHSDHLVEKTAAMQKVRVTKLISSTPDEAGQVKVQLANGAIVPIPQATEKKVMSRAAQQAAHPDGTVSGNCGSSFITLSEKPNGYPVAMRTGFTVVEPAIGYDWSASVIGPDYFYDYENGGFLDFDSSWEGGHQSSENRAEGLYFAAVDPAGSDAVLLDGTVCFSGGPTDEEFLIAQAECLNHIPATAFFSGGGWINNTVTHVDHKNITTTPDGPAARASTATACLADTVEGSPAAGNITGWQDARLFATDNGHNPDKALARCHLIARQFGGPGQAGDGGPANLVPCWQVGTNTGTPSMETNETKVARAVRRLADNEAVYYRVTPEYFDSDSTIPYEIVMSAEVQHANGTSTPLFTSVIDNAPTGNPLLNLGN
jgi:DNA/RNA non-specific endonuclease